MQMLLEPGIPFLSRRTPSSLIFIQAADINTATILSAFMVSVAMFMLILVNRVNNFRQ
jgi:hypothetical protein